MNIAFVNELSIIFERLEIDTLEVLEAAGSKWNFLPFRPGMVGGHCIGVDPYYLTHKAEEVGYDPEVILAGRRINDNMAKHAAQSIVKRMLKLGVDIPKANVGILGITFKENCPDVRNTKILDLYRELQEWSVEPLVYDPWADPEELRAEFKIDMVEFEQMVDLDALIVAVGHNEFRALCPAELKDRCRNGDALLADLKSIYDREALERQGLTVFRL